VLDTTLIPAIVRARASGKGLFAGQATFGRCVSKTEWVYGFKVALSVTPEKPRLNVWDAWADQH
jgi:hypothetical protein